MNINLHIERLILDGVNVPHGQRHLLRANVEAELGRLMSKGGVPPSLENGGAVPSVSAKGIQTTGGNDPAQLGQQIARSVYGGIGK